MAREERVARPTRTDEFEVVAADKGVADEWDRWAKQEPNALATAYDQLASNPTQFSSRQKRLEGKTYATGTYEGKTYDRWQYEATAGGRSSTSSTTRPMAAARSWRARAAGRRHADESSSRRSIPATRRRPSASADETFLRLRRASAPLSVRTTATDR